MTEKINLNSASFTNESRVKLIKSLLKNVSESEIYEYDNFIANLVNKNHHAYFIDLIVASKFDASIFMDDIYIDESILIKLEKELKATQLKLTQLSKILAYGKRC